jgi:ATP-binding cassette subfamily C (CFTR/MRP) protein 1
LSHISLHIVAGEKIGICGRTGRYIFKFPHCLLIRTPFDLTLILIISGKSSLLSTLLRSLDLEDGTIFIDGIDIATVSRSLIRTRLIAVPQDGFILPGTVRFNADPSTLISDGEIIKAMTKVHLWPTLSSRGGLDAEMSKEPLSHGQQQLFCLGRALLRKEKAKILILDEATSSMDVKIDEIVRKVVLEEFKEHTVIIIAHRLESIVDLERVVVLEGGEIAEVGVPRDLLKIESKFRAFYVGEGNVEEI